MHFTNHHNPGANLQADFFSTLLPPVSNAPLPPPPHPSPPVKAAKAVAKTGAPVVNKPVPETDPDELAHYKQLLEEIDEEDFDECPIFDLSPRYRDSTDTFVAKRLMRLLLADLSGKTVAEPDLFGHIEAERENRKLDALIWLYDLNPDGAAISFDWVCDEIGIDGEMLRRVTARNMRAELKRLLARLACIIPEEVFNCECQLGTYVNLTGWQKT